MYAGKIVTRNDISYIKHSCIDNLLAKQTHRLQMHLKITPIWLSKPADKGGAVVVMRADLYKQGVLR